MADGEGEWRLDRETYFLPVANLDNNFGQLFPTAILPWWSIQTTNL